jgi:PDZ domain-containing protein
MLRRWRSQADVARACSRSQGWRDELWRGIMAALATIFLIAALAGIGAFVPTPFVLVTPGSVLDTTALVTVSLAEPTHTTRGRLYLTSVRTMPASATLWLLGKLNPEAALVPREQARPPDMSEREYRAVLTTMMGESKSTALLVALRAAGYDVQPALQGARVEQVRQGAAAEGLLVPGDIVMALDEEPVSTAGQLAQAVRSRRPGDTLHLTILRAGAREDLTVTVGAAPDDSGRAFLGVSISTYVNTAALPVSAQIRTSELGGPSAGLMFALAIYNALAPEDITHGQSIAGTGALTIEGGVTGVGSVEQKVHGAERKGAAYFLVPAENYEEARRAARRIRVIAVKTFDEALTALRALPDA